MGENETDKPAQDEQEKTVEEAADTSKENDGAEAEPEAGDSPDDKNKGGSDDEEETDDDEANDDKKSKETTAKDAKKDEDKEPPTRKRPIDFIKERQERRKAKQGDSDKSKNDDEDEDDDIDPADKETIGKVVEKALKPFIEKEAKQQDETEIKEFLTANPDFKAYEAKARKYMSHPSRKDVPISEIFYGVAGADLLKIGAKRAKIADNESKKTRTGGGADGGGDGQKSVKEMSRAELEAKQNAVRAKLADRG